MDRLRDKPEPAVALLRMPTGTGKTGVMAVLSVVFAPPGWTLILTPWANLCDQLITDIRERFWRVSEWRPSPAPKVERLYPSMARAFSKKKDDRLILVATFATLVSIFKNQESDYKDLGAKLSQVFVDEGHYEPAVEWGQAVKQLLTPTLLLTATPYRNDLKLFRVSEDAVFQYTHESAEADGIIRSVTFKELKVDEPNFDQLPRWCKAFADFWTGPERKRLAKDARVIICCSDMATVERTTQLLRRRGIEAMGIHDCFGGRKEDWLRQRPRLRIGRLRCLGSPK